MSQPKMGDAYERYMLHVNAAIARGLTLDHIIKELHAEKETLKPRATIKAASLAMDPNPYKKREAIRAAHECMTAIERIIQELQDKKEIHV